MIPFRKIVVLGLGASGRSAAGWLGDRQISVIATDDDPAARDNAGLPGIPVLPVSPALLAGADALLLSPGVPVTFPAPHPLVVAARAAGIPLISDIELFVRSSPGVRLAGITGSNGKSTVTALLAHILAEAGLPAVAAGNIGLPVLDAPASAGICILELSSWQLEITPSLRLEAAAILNITPDHLDRHGDMAGYARAKCRILDALPPGGLAVLGDGDPMVRAIAVRLALEGRTTLARVGTSARGRAVRLVDGVLTDMDGTPVTGMAACPNLPGPHNAANAGVALVMARHFGLGTDAIARGLRSFPGLPHRLEMVARDGHVSFVNDSKATNAEATARALSAFEDIFWIAGGIPKPGGISALAPFFPRLRGVYLIGQAGAGFHAFLSSRGVGSVTCGTLDRAVARAAADARGAGAGVVLLSPACASFDQFRNYEARGDAFRDLVRTMTGQDATAGDGRERTPGQPAGAALRGRAPGLPFNSPRSSMQGQRVRPPERGRGSGPGIPKG